MAVTQQTIDAVLERYLRERDRYTKLTRLVEDLCREQVTGQLSIRAYITSRTKNAGSLEKKLLRFMRSPQKVNLTTVEDVFAELSDLSGVRIALYSQSEQAKAIEAIRELFTGPESGPMEVDIKDKRAQDERNFYRAVHCQVYLRDQHLLGDNDNLAGLGCEVQICSMMAHVWNEIEHDIGYKPHGDIGNLEKQCLLDLGTLVRQGDQIIDKLLKANEAQVQFNIERMQAAQQEEDSLVRPPSAPDSEIADEMELQLALKAIFKIQRVTFDSRSLFTELTRLGLTRYQQLHDLFSGESWQNARAEIGRFNTYLNRCNLAYQLNATQSTDPALMILLRKKHEEILALLPAGGRGLGRPVKIRTLAQRYAEFANQERRS